MYFVVKKFVDNSQIIHNCKLVKRREYNSFIPNREGSNGNIAESKFYVQTFINNESGISGFAKALRCSYDVTDRNRYFAQMSIPCF